MWATNWIPIITMQQDEEEYPMVANNIMALVFQNRIFIEDDLLESSQLSQKRIGKATAANGKFDYTSKAKDYKC